MLGIISNQEPVLPVDVLLMSHLIMYRVSDENENILLEENRDESQNGLSLWQSQDFPNTTKIGMFRSESSSRSRKGQSLSNKKQELSQKCSAWKGFVPSP